MLRLRRAELMDDPDLQADIHIAALNGLERLNRFSLTVHSLWHRLRRFEKERKQERVRVLDLATGSGDILISLEKLSKKANLPFEFTGADISSTAIAYANERAAKKGFSSSFLQLDCTKDDLPLGFDVIMTSLFTHHLDPDMVIRLLHKMSGATKSLLLVNDLVRSEFAWAIVFLSSRILSRSKVVHHDGTASVEAAYTMAEMAAMAKQAGLNNILLEWSFPCRQLLSWEKTV